MGILDGLLGGFKKQGQQAFNNVITTGAAASKNASVQQAVQTMTKSQNNNTTRATAVRAEEIKTISNNKTEAKAFDLGEALGGAARTVLNATPFGVAAQASNALSGKTQTVKDAQDQATPFDGALAVTKPIYDWGQGASQWWTQNADPVIVKAIDAVPYLGPSKLPSLETGTLVTATPLTNGGTRITPNWESDAGHDALKGAASDLPKHSVEFVTAAPAALSWLGQEVYKDPVAAATKVGGGALLVYEGMSTAATENPARFAGEMAAGFIIGDRPVRVAASAAKAGTLDIGAALGLVRSKTVGFKGEELIPYLSPAEEVETIFESQTISGVRGTSSPAGTFLPVRRLRVRNPGSIGDIPAGELVDASGAFMTLSRPELEPYGTYFLTKSGGIKGALAGKRVYIQEDIRTVQVPDTLKNEIYTSIRTKGEFWGEAYDKVLDLAIEQSEKFGEPVAVPSPKRAKGIMQPENEVFLVFASDEATRITQTRWAGFSVDGVPVKRIRYGRQSPIETGRIESIVENINYNWDIGRAGAKLYNRNYLKADARNMYRRLSELYEGGLSYPGSYSSHGPAHDLGVYNNFVDQWTRSPTLQAEASLNDLWLRSKYHDIDKIYDFETEPLPHAFAAGEAIRTGLFNPPDIAALTPKQRNLLAKDIGGHTNIKPGFGIQGLITKFARRPTNTGMALATADRMDLARFGVSPDWSKLFDIPENRLGFQIKSTTGDMITGKTDLPIGFRTKNVPLTDEKWSEIAGIFSPRNAPRSVRSPDYSYKYPATAPSGLASLGFPEKEIPKEYGGRPADLHAIISPGNYPTKSKKSSGYEYPQESSGYSGIQVASAYPLGSSGYAPTEEITYLGAEYPQKNALPDYLPTDYGDGAPTGYVGVGYVPGTAPPSSPGDYVLGGNGRARFYPSPLPIIPDLGAISSPPRKTKRKKRKKKHPRKRNAFDWIVWNPVPDIPFIFGMPEDNNEAPWFDVPDVIFAPVKRQSKGKQKNIFEVKF